MNKTKVNPKPSEKTISNKRNRNSLKELFKDYNGDYEPKEIDWGEPIGEEVW